MGGESGEGYIVGKRVQVKGQGSLRRGSKRSENKRYNEMK